jgi:hypothetical protein
MRVDGNTLVTARHLASAMARRIKQLRADDEHRRAVISRLKESVSV